MPNKIKYTTTPTANTIKVGNFVLGVVTGVTYGPTSTTSFYNGYDVPSGGYVVYQNKATLGPSVFAPTGNTQMVNLTKALGNATATTIYDSLKWINTQNTIIAVNRNYENIVTSGLTMLLDAGFTPSYPLSGTSWTDLSFSGNNGTLINGPTFNSANGGSIVFDGVDDYVSFGVINLISGTNATIEVWVNSSSPQNQYSDILDYNHSGGGFVIQQNSTSLNQYYFAYWNGSGFDITPTITIPTNSWCQLVFVKSGTSTIGYLNSVNTVSYVGSANFTGSGLDLALGRWLGGGGRNFNGKISTTRIYNRALSSTEVLQNYNALKGRFGL